MLGAAQKFSSKFEQFEGDTTESLMLASRFTRHPHAELSITAPQMEFADEHLEKVRETGVAKSSEYACIQLKQLAVQSQRRNGGSHDGRAQCRREILAV
jgi:hypothetical protein